MNHIIGKHIFLQHPDTQQGDVEYYKRKKIFLEEANLLSHKRITFRDIDKGEIDKSIFKIKHVVFEVTEHCNLNCVYCAFGEIYSGNVERIKERRNMKPEDAIKLLEHLYPAWKEREIMGLPQRIMIGFYGGEPLLNYTLMEAIVLWAKEHATSLLKFEFSVTTNGLLLNKYMDFLVKHGFIVSISLDGNEENMSYRIDHQGESCFKRVVNNIMILKKDYPDFFDKKVAFLTVLHNKNSVEQVTNFCMTYFNKMPICSNLNDSGVAPQKKAIFSEMYETIPDKVSKKNLKTMIRAGSGLNDVINLLQFFSGFYFYNYNALLQKDIINEVRVTPTGCCIPFSREIYMSINGNLYPCERIDACFAMGNIHDTPVLDTAQIASRYNQYYKKLCSVCSPCKRKFSCKKCLFHIDTIQEKKPQCDNIMKWEKFNEMVDFNISICKKHPELYRIIIKQIKFAL